MGILNLCFADNLLLFVRGDLISIQLLMQQIESFSGSTVLVGDVAKCKLYFGGVTESVQQETLGVTGFHKGKLSFKYLVVPLDSKKLTVENCNPLIEKVISRTVQIAKLWWQGTID